MRRTGFALLIVFFCMANAAQAALFSDVPDTHPAATAISYVKEKGIMRGYDDGTFGPNKAISRAEVAKILVLTRLTEMDVQQFTKRSFTDVPDDAWYRPYVEAALLELGIIDGPPKATIFRGGTVVKKAEFLKMLLKAQDIDASGAFAEIRLPLSSDASDSGAWYYPYLRYALSASLEQVENNGTLRPDKDLTRADAATRIYRLAMYTEGRRTQALLSAEEDDLVNVLSLLEAGDVDQAEFASARALIAARGAHASTSDVAIVQAAVKIAEAFRSLVRAYRAGTNGDTQAVIALSKEAWASAERARALSPTLSDLAGSVQQIAGSMANEARSVQQQQ